MAINLQRHINSSSSNSAGGNGSTNGVSGDNRAYLDIDEWITQEAADIVANYQEVSVSNVDEDPTAFVIDDALTFTGGATAKMKSFDGSTMMYVIATGTPADTDTITGPGGTPATCDIDTIDFTGGKHTVTCIAGDTTADPSSDTSLTGWTTDSSFFITINGEAHGGKYNTSTYRIEFTVATTYDEGLRVTEGFTVVNDLQGTFTNDGKNTFRGFESAATEVFWNRCICVGVISGTPTSTEGFVHTNSVSGDCRACLAYDWTDGTVGFRGESNTTASNFQNCTAHNCATGFSTATTDTIPTNCLAQDNTNGFAGSWSGGDTNCSSIDGDAPGSDPLTFGDVLFVDEDANDFQPSSSDTVVTGVAVTDLTGTFDFDLANNSWGGTMNCGCLLSQVAGGEEFLGRQYPQGVKRGVMRGVA